MTSSEPHIWTKASTRVALFWSEMSTIKQGTVTSDRPKYHIIIVTSIAVWWLPSHPLVDQPCICLPRMLSHALRKSARPIDSVQLSAIKSLRALAPLLFFCLRDELTNAFICNNLVPNHSIFNSGFSLDGSTRLTDFELGNFRVDVTKTFVMLRNRSRSSMLPGRFCGTRQVGIRSTRVFCARCVNLPSFSNRPTKICRSLTTLVDLSHNCTSPTHGQSTPPRNSVYGWHSRDTEIVGIGSRKGSSSWNMLVSSQLDTMRDNFIPPPPTRQTHSAKHSKINVRRVSLIYER